MVLGKLPVSGRPTVWMIVSQGPNALAIGAGGGCLDIFTLLCPFSSFSLSLGDGLIWTEVLYRRAAKPKTTNKPTNFHFKKIIVRYKKRLVIIYMFCDRRHAWLLIQSRLTALLTSLIA